MVNDGVVDSAIATVSITVTAVNDAPVAGTQTIITNEDISVPINLTGTDIDGDTLSYSIVAQPVGGVITGTTPNLSYTPNANLNGTDTLSFLVNDGTIDSPASEVTIIVNAINDAPVANDQSVSTNEDTALAITLTGYDIEGQALNYTLVSQPTNGVLTGTAPDLTYTPNANISGVDNFTFLVNDGEIDSSVATVSIQINAVNDAPVANPQILETNEDVAVDIVLTAADIDSPALSYAVVSQPANGTLSGTAPNLLYVPNPDFNGNDSFSFIANDGLADSAIETVSISITSVNDTPIANSQSVTTDEDTNVLITLSGTDIDGDNLSYTIISAPANGTLTGTAPDLTYVPNVNFNGADAFTFIVNDGTVDSVPATVSIVINPVNDVPVANNQAVVTDEDASISIVLTGQDIDADTLSYAIASQPGNGILSGIPPNIVYTPNSNFNGTDGFTFLVNDGISNSVIATVSLMVNAVNDAPVSASQVLSVPEDGSLPITLSASDVDGDALTFVTISQPVNGMINGVAPNLNFVPNPDFNGNDSFTFKANDGVADSAIETISINVSAVNDAPVSSSQSVTTDEDTSVSIVLVGTDIDGDTLTYTVTTPPVNGLLTGVAPNLSYVPNSNFNGTDSFSYLVNDGTVNSGISTVSININGVNDAPSITSTPVTSVNERDVYTYAISIVDPDAGESFTYSLPVFPVGMLIDNNGVINWTPGSDQIGNHSVTVTVTDSAGLSQSQNFVVTVNNVNDAPIITSAAVLNAEENSLYTYDVNATDPDSGDSLTYSLQTYPTGMVIDSLTGVISWTPDKTQIGNQAVVVIVSDTAGLTDIQNFTITVSPQNQAPEITSTPINLAVVGQLYQYNVNATDIDGDSLTYRLPVAPAGMSIDSLTGLISWQTAETDIGNHQVVVDVSDTSGASVTQTFNINVSTVMSNEGQDFWVMFNEDVESPVANAINKLLIYITSRFSASGTVDIPNLNISIPFTTQAGGSITVDLTPYHDQLLTTFDGLSSGANNAIHVTSDKSIAVYSMSQATSSTDGTLVLPTRALGKSYIALTHGNGDYIETVIPWSISDQTPGSNKYTYGSGQLGVLATEDGTVVTYHFAEDTTLYEGKSRAATDRKFIAGETYVVNLNRGETHGFNFRETHGGSGISIDSNKPVGVFAGSRSAYVPLRDTLYADHLVEQLPPTKYWGQEYMAMPLASRLGGDTYRIVAAFDNTDIRYNGNIITTLNKGEWLQDTLEGPITFTANHPFLVAQLANGTYFDDNLKGGSATRGKADPFMLLLTSKEQYLTHYIFTSPEDRFAELNFINVIAPASAIADMRLDGQPVDVSVFVEIPNNPGYKGAQLPITTGSHEISSSEPFGASIYGFDTADSYGYNGGVLLPDITANTTLSLTTSNAALPVATQSCSTARVIEGGQAVANVRVDFIISGVHSKVEHVLTDTNGEATYCYIGYKTGTDVITAQLETNTAMATTDWQPMPEGNGNTTPLILTEQLPDAAIGVQYSAEIVVLDADINTELNYSIETLTPGIGITTNGQITWMPVENQIGTHTIKVSVTDNTGINVSRTYTIRASQRNRAPEVIIAPETIAPVNRSGKYHKPFSVSDPDDEPIMMRLLGAPSGVEVSSLYIGQDLAYGFTEYSIPQLFSKNVSINDLGDHAVTLELRDLRGATTRYNFTLTMVENRPPVFISYPSTLEAITGHSYIYPLVVDDPDSDQGTFSLVSGPVGMTVSQYGSLGWIPADNQLGDQSVTVQFDDGFGGLVQQSFTLNVVPNSPPQVTSNPDGIAIADQSYIYNPVAVDADGDRLSFSLETSPAGMTVYARTGTISWTPTIDQLGQHNVVLLVDDGAGAIAVHSFSVLVTDGTGTNINQPPGIDSQPGTKGKVGLLYQYQLSATDPEGDLLTYQLTQAPAGMSVSSTGEISWTADISGTVPVKVRVTDSVGNYIEQGWSILVLSADLLLTADVTITPDFVNDGDTVTIQVNGSNIIGTPTVELAVDGSPVALDDNYQAQIVASGIGTHSVDVSISDQYETASKSRSFYVKDVSDITPPVVSISQPALSTKVTAPVDIIASASDSNLLNWRLFYYKTSSAPSEFTVLAEGTTSVTDQVLGRFDPSMLKNGQYTIALEATDAGGNRSVNGTRVTVEGDLKVGNFSFTLEDMNIALAGIPIRVTRTYDTRQKSSDLDFGYGWSIGYQDVDIQESSEPTDSWYTYDSVSTFIIDGQLSNQASTCSASTREKLVTITLPNGDVEKFNVVAKAVGGGLVSINDPSCSLLASRYFDLEFIPQDGTLSRLVSLDGFSLYLTDMAGGNLVKDITLTEPFDTKAYELTTRSGYVYTLDQYFGIQTVTDPNGNSLTYSNDGIVHSSGQRIDFIRDAQNRITAITKYGLSSTIQLTYEYNRNGNLIAVTDESDNVSTYTYNNEHALMEMFDPLGRRLLRNIYDATGRLIAQEDNDGNRTDFNHDIAGRQSIITDRLGRITAMYYDDEGNVTSQLDAYNNLTLYTYDANGNQLSKTDALSRLTQATYNANNDQLTQTDALGNTIVYTYNDRGQELTITDESGDVFINNYDTAGNLLSIQDPLGNIASNTVNPQGLPELVRDAMGNETTYTYYANGNKKTEIDPLGTQKSYNYDAYSNLTFESELWRDASGAQVSRYTSYGYNVRGQLIKTTDALNNVTRIEYNAVGKQSATIDALGNRTEYDYDAYGRLIETRYPDGSVENKSYDAEGNLLSETNRLGQITSYDYDALNRLIQTTYADGTFTQTEYDAVGQVIAEIDAKGNRTRYDYDLAGRRTQSTDALGNVHQFDYDADGNLIAETDALNRTTTYVYDALDRKVQTLYHNASSSQSGYDALGRNTARTDQANITTQYAYDPLGRLISVTDTLGQVTTYAYDGVGNKISQTDAEGRTTQWSYDKLGRVLSRTLPMGQVESFTYDANGNVLTHTNFNGELTRNTYDINNQLVQIDYTDGTSESFTYDAMGNRLTASNAQGTWVYTYDDMNRLASETKPGGDVLSYTYDENGNKTSLTITDANGASRTQSFAYDALNRLISVTDNAGGITSYGYDAVGNRTSISYPNGSSQTYAYDDLNRLIQVSNYDGTGVLIQQLDYTLDASGHRIQIDESSGRSTAYTYDDLYRLTDEIITDSINGDYIANYQYDGVGNRTYSTINGVQTAYTYDDNDRLLQQGGETYTYDDQGNTLSKSIDTDITNYYYNARQNLVSVEITQAGLTKTLSYQYNPDGIRIQKVEEGNATDYLIDSNRPYAQVLKETNATTGDIIDYLYGDDLIRQSQNSASERYYLYDGLGSTRALTDETGVVTDSYDYEAFGGTLNKTGTTENSYLFAGEQFDAGLDNYYLRARYYNQKAGRFTQQDTYLGNNSDPITLHKYLYANADAINGIDPSGNMTMLQVGATVGLVGTLAQISNPAFILMGQELTQGWTKEGGVSAIQGGWLVLAAFDLNSTLFKLVTAKALMRDKGRAAVIGESMDRVKAYAAAIGGEYWDIPGEYVSEIANRKWINRVMDREMIIFDVGPSPYGKSYPKPSSKFYKLELRQIVNRKYPNYIKAF